MIRQSATICAFALIALIAPNIVPATTTTELPQRRIDSTFGDYEHRLLDDVETTESNPLRNDKQTLVKTGAAPQAKVRRRLVLIGDSTVKNGRGRGDGGLYGWGQVLDQHFDASRIEIENRALGGRSSRTYLTEGLWKKSLDRLRKGDFVMIQFGHNDGGETFKGDRPRASIKGNGDETIDGVVENTGKSETVHSYGWYLRKYAADAKAKGAIPIVLSLVPRDRWQDGRVIRSDEDYAQWARQAAEQTEALFIDLNEIVACRYEALGEDKVGRDLFTPDDWTHTTRAGAEINAECVVKGVRALKECSLKDYLRKNQTDKTQSDWRFDFTDGLEIANFQTVAPAMSILHSEDSGFCGRSH